MPNRLRRYPALGFLAVAALLASLLPSALRVPLSGPTASAELAPVPGKSDTAQGDLSALGQTSTGGLGSGAGIGGTGPGGSGGSRLSELDAGEAPPPPPSGGGRNPRNKRCVGNPPRQTEDPLSPPCVAFFDGDNGGATAKGVTRDEVRLVYYGEACSRTGAVYTDYDDPTVTDSFAAWVRYFNDRFQTYGRRVHLWVVKPPCGVDAVGFVSEIDQRLDPFFLYRVATDKEAVAQEAARLGMLTVLGGAKRETMARYPGHILSYPPDLDDTMQSAGEFLCARLAGRPARFAGDPTMHGTKRKFGLVYSNNSDRADEGVKWFTAAVRERCGEAAGEIELGGGNGNGNDTLARFRTRGVTTVVYRSNDLLFLASADGAKWYPEWFIPDGESNAPIAHNGLARAFIPTQMRSAFGITHRRRLGPPSEQPHRVAFHEGCRGCAAPPTFDGDGYNDLLLLFTGIQAAGPRLTPANFDKGLRAIAPRQSTDPFVPAAYFAPGNWSFVKDFLVAWWDPTGPPAGSSTPNGCWRLVEDGRRYRAQDWASRPGDEGIQGPGQPCQGDQ